MSQAHQPTDAPSDDRTQLLPSVAFWLQVRCKHFLEEGPSVCLPLFLATEGIQSDTRASFFSLPTWTEPSSSSGIPGLQRQAKTVRGKYPAPQTVQLQGSLPL